MIFFVLRFLHRAESLVGFSIFYYYFSVLKEPTTMQAHSEANRNVVKRCVRYKLSKESCATKAKSTKKSKENKTFETNTIISHSQTSHSISATVPPSTYCCCSMETYLSLARFQQQERHRRKGCEGLNLAAQIGWKGDIGKCGDGRRYVNFGRRKFFLEKNHEC